MPSTLTRRAARLALIDKRWRYVPGTGGLVPRLRLIRCNISDSPLQIERVFSSTGNVSLGGVIEANQDLVEALGGLRQAIDAPTLCLSAQELGQRLLLAYELKTAVDALVVSLAHDADDAAVGPAHGVRTTAQFVAGRQNVSAKTVGVDRSLGRWLRNFALFEDGFARGDLTLGHLRQLRSIDTPRTRAAMVTDQQIFVDAGRDCSYPDFGVAVGYWLNRHDPDGVEPRVQLAKTGLSVKQNPDGSVEGSFYLDSLKGQVVIAALGREMKRLRKRRPKGVELTQRQEQADAFTSLVTKGAKQKKKATYFPLINLVVGLDVAEEIVRRVASQEPIDEPWPLDPEDPNGRCEAIDGTPIHPHFVMAAMIARFQRHVFDAEGTIVETSQARIFPDRMKQIFALESRGRCSTLGCDAPFHWLQADHITPHSKGGISSHDNGQMLCEPENMWKSDRDLGTDEAA